MGRIEVEGMILVDLPEAIELVGKSRATVFRLLKAGELTKIDVGGTKTRYVTLESIDRYKNHGPQFMLKELEPDSVRKKRRTELKRWFPQQFK